MDILQIQDWAKQDHFAFKRHTLLRMFQRNITTDEVKQALEKCELIEDYPTDKPLPSGLVLGYTSKKRPLHLVVALEEEKKIVWVITVYEPDLTSWKKDLKERKKI